MLCAVVQCAMQNPLLTHPMDAALRMPEGKLYLQGLCLLSHPLPFAANPQQL